MTPAEFRAARAKVQPWSVDRVRDELAKAMQAARDALELGVHVHVPSHSVTCVREIARCGGWCAVQAQKPDTHGNVRVTFTAGPESMVDMQRFCGDLHTTTGGRVLFTAAEHARYIAESKPIQPTAAAKLVDDALAASLQAAEDDVPAVRVRRHSAQLVVDAAAAQGWHCYVEHRGHFINEIPIDVQANDEVVLGLFGESFVLEGGETLAPLVPTVRRNDNTCASPEHTFDFHRCDRCAEKYRRSPESGCRFSPDKANGAGDRRWEDDKP